MSRATNAPQRARNIYAMPEAAHLELVQVRNQLQLMAQLTTAASYGNTHDAHLRPDVLAWWFSRLQQDVDGVIAASSCGTEAATAYNTAGKSRNRGAAAKDKQ